MSKDIKYIRKFKLAGASKKYISTFQSLILLKGNGEEVP